MNRLLYLLLAFLFALQLQAQYKPKRDTSKDHVAPVANVKPKGTPSKNKPDKDKPKDESSKAKNSISKAKNSISKGKPKDKNGKPSHQKKNKKPARHSKDSLYTVDTLDGTSLLVRAKDTIRQNTLMLPESFSVDKQMILFPHKGGTDTIRISGVKHWHVIIQPDNAWISLKREENQMMLTLTPNNSTIPRTDFMVITNDEDKIRIAIRQAGKTPNDQYPEQLK